MTAAAGAAAVDAFATAVEATLVAAVLATAAVAAAAGTLDMVAASGDLAVHAVANSRVDINRVDFSMARACMGKSSKIRVAIGKAESR